MVAPMPVGAVLVSHCAAARLAEFPVFGDHAFGDFRHVRDEVRTKPHRIRRTCLPGFLRALRTGAGQADKK